jgi:CubicO group peptidase (beta-lactamase class C family)
MIGAPPPAAEQVTLENWLSPEFNAWSFQHLEAILPTTTVDRGTGPVSALDAQPYDLGKFEFTDFTGKKRNLAQFLDDQHIDALVLWSHGKLRQEVYRNGETARTRHLMMSVTKSFTGLVAEMLTPKQARRDETGRLRPS